MLLLVAAGCASRDTGPATPTATSSSALGLTPPATDTEEWVRQRLEAVSDLYRVTPGGRLVLAALDVRQMRGQPGYFGSFGFDSWTGLGEAKPTQTIHELGHAYWGAFPVTGHPDLSWDAGGEEVSPAMQLYHQDTVRFLTQPPDRYELFRQRLKNLPELASDNLAPLYHTIEADVVSMVGGDLGLVPPILRKYWDGFLSPGPFLQWEEAVRWYLGLASKERARADRYLGFQHLDLREQDHLKPDGPSVVDATVRQILEGEERQRLWDFADQFDLVAQDAEKAEQFKFWRGYLREIQALFRVHRGLLEDSDLPRSREIIEAFDLLHELAGEAPAAKAARLVQALRDRPFTAHFLPALDNETLVELFTSADGLPEETTGKGIRPFVEQVQRFAPTVADILTAGAAAPAEGAAALRLFLSSLDLDDREETDLFFELFLEADSETAKAVAASLDNETKRSLLQAAPVLLRRLLDPSELARALDITADATPQQMAQGVALILEHPSGNFRIDEPYLDEVNEVVAQRGEREPAQMLDVLAGEALPVERFIHQHPSAAVAILSADLDATVALVKGSDPVLLTPARFIHALVFASPALAAQVVARLDSDGEEAIVLESLAVGAYDEARVEADPTLPITLRKDGAFLGALLERKGQPWLAERLGEAVMLYRDRVRAQEVPPDFLEAYRRTLEGAAGTMDGATQSGLLESIETAFGADS